MRIGIIFDNFGPYHQARLRAAAQVGEVTAIQVSERSAEYAWETEAGAIGVPVLTLFPAGASGAEIDREVVPKIGRALDECRPHVVFIPGWSGRAAFAALRWCVQNKVPAVAMSESTAWDEVRVGWKEAIKRRLVSLFSAALVGGHPHRDYMVELGMPSNRVFLGYDIVDNDYYATRAADSRARTAEVRARLALPENYFLASARFVVKKNLPLLLEAYARYRELASGGWPLVLLGDGPLREMLRLQIGRLGLERHVHLPGFRQYPELPSYYALAAAFIHASTVEQWGLVVNEAMASGCPVIVSNRCGCAVDLVREGENGFTFDPADKEALAQILHRVSAMEPAARDALGAASRQRIAQWGPARFAQGVEQASRAALDAGVRSPGLITRLLLHGLLIR